MSIADFVIPSISAGETLFAAPGIIRKRSVPDAGDAGFIANHRHASIRCTGVSQ